MTKGIFGTLMIVFLGGNNLLQAKYCDNMEAQVFDVGGFTIADSKLKILAENKFTQYSINLGEDEVVNKITRLITKVNPNPRGSASPKALAQNIFDSSKAYGVDPILYAAKIWQESGQFNVDVVAPGGDTGLSQMTGDGLDEISAQYKKLKSKNKDERQVGNILAELSQNYFSTPNSTNDWIDWVLTQSNTQKKRTLVKSVEYALAAGASLFKIYLAAKNGNYKNAINQYNGGGVKDYYGKINNKADHLRQKVSHSCHLSEAEMQHLEAVCAIADSEQGCEALISEILPQSEKYYDI